jgi:hypothetical protein
MRRILRPQVVSKVHGKNPEGKEGEWEKWRV